jgi:DNA-binding CsgD family transcriptional regulator
MDQKMNTGSNERRGTLIGIATQLREQAAELERQAEGITDRAIERMDGRPPWAAILNCEMASDETDDTAWVHRASDAAGRGMAERAIYAARQGHADLSFLLSARAETSPSLDPESLVGIALARTLSTLSDNRPTDAYEALLALFGEWRDSAIDRAAGPLMGVFVEAGIRARKPHEAEYVFQEWVIRTETDVNDASHSEPFVAEILIKMYNAAMIGSVALPSGSMPELVTARLQLALGMWLRRARRLLEARAHLIAARSILSRPGGAPWRALCDSELAAATLVRRPTGAAELLSTQQLAVARLVAEGLSNRDIAHRLCVSPRTVSSHLYRIFPALGISSRSQLAAALVEMNPHTQSA